MYSRRALSLVVFCCLSLHVLARSQDTTTQSTPGEDDPKAGWKDAPKQRGTLMLVYGCLTAVFASTWTVLHLNLPVRRDSFWTKAIRKAKWMAVTIMFPEFILSKAICELRLALSTLHKLDVYLRDNADKLWWQSEVTVVGVTFARSWRWRVKYGTWVRRLYRPLFLPAPTDATNDATAPDNDQAVSRNSGTDEIVGEADAVLENDSVASISDATGLQNSRESDEDKDKDEVPESGVMATGNDEIADTEEPHPPTLPGDQQSKEGRGSILGEGLEGTDGQAGVAAARQRSQKRTEWHEDRLWTLTHSYYANMGGLLYTYRADDPTEEPTHYALTVPILACDWVDPDVSHPLRNLALSEEDIQDKSKADWLLKMIAIGQITWLVFDVAVRASMGLPVTQLEIATIAFSIFAIATYVANLWKPKDVSVPTIIETPSFTFGEGREPLQEFVTLLKSPAEAQKRFEHLLDRERIRNDTVWIRGDVPLISSLMAGSSLVFGGLHCLAWTSEFPSYTELILWRAMSIVSALAPGISLTFSLFLNLMATRYAERACVSVILSRLKPLDRFEDWWNSLGPPDARGTTYSTPTTQVAPTNIDPAMYHIIHSTCHNYRIFREAWSDIKTEGASHDNIVLFLKFYEWLRGDLKSHNELEHDAWCSYERHHSEKVAARGQPAPELSVAGFFLELQDTVDQQIREMNERQRFWDRVSRASSIISSTLYVAARVTLLVQVFMSLRLVPEEVYNNTPWTRFIPSIS